MVATSSALPVLARMHFWLLSGLLFALTTTAMDAQWYVSPVGSGNATFCGADRENPCNDILLVLSRNYTFSNQCYLPKNGSGLGTTTFFFEGTNYLPPLCMSQWSNLRFAGLGNNATLIVRQVTSLYGLLTVSNCTNVTVQSLQLLSSLIGRSVLFVDNSRNVSIWDCVVAVTGEGSIGLDIVDSSGDITVESTLFYGNGASGDGASGAQVPFRALQVIQGAAQGPFNLYICNCVFRDLASDSGASVPTDDSYEGVYREAVGLVLTLDANAAGNVVTIQNSLFTRLQSTASNVVGVDFDTASSGNLVQFVGCEFKDNTARYGGGVSAYFWSGSNNNVLQVRDCSFINNTATLEGGGVLGVFISEQVDNKLDIQSSTFIGNSATYGAGVFVLNNPAWYDYTGTTYNITPALVSVNISGCTFINNTASISEGIVSVLRVLLYVNGVSTFTGNTGSGILLRLSYAHISDNITFEGNMAENGAAIQIQDLSRVDLSGVKHGCFAHNRATFTGGAIYVDDTSATAINVEYMHRRADNLPGSCVIRFGDELLLKPNDTRFIFDNNTALSGGQSIQAYSLRSCLLYNFVPTELHTFLPFVGDGVVQYVNTPVLGTTSTGPSFVYFYGASTKCYKPVGNITYLMPNCSSHLLNRTFYRHPNLQCGIRQSALAQSTSFGNGLGPTTNRLFLPWSGVLDSWIDYTWTQCPEPIPAQVVLSPAPGEMFDLTVQVVDQLLTVASDNAYLQVGYEDGKVPDVLIQLNGFQYAYDDRIYFTPNQPVLGVSLVGLPGTKGQLSIIVESEIAEKNIKLLVPFQLAQCPLGYYDPPGASTVDEVHQLLTTVFATTQRIPADNALACQCFTDDSERIKSSVLQAPISCIQGYTVELSSALWAGFLPVGNSSLRPTPVDCPTIPINALPYQDRQTQLFLAQKKPNTDPIDVVLYDNSIIPGGGAPVTCYQGYTIEDIINYKPGGPFAVEYCFSSFCRGNSLSNWYLADVNGPCVENREGPLCGSCKPGYALTLYSTSCRDCSNARIYAPVLTTVIIGAVIVVLAVAFNLGLSPTFDSFLFFIQTILVVVAGRTGYASFPVVLAFFNPDFTFNQCITPTLTALERLLLQYITPLYILSLLMVVLALTSVKGLSKVLGRHSFLQALWLLFMISYFNIANTTFAIIHCTPVGPDNELVLVEDPSVVCYTGTHLAWSIVAIIVAIVFVVPFPLYVIILYRIPRYKPVTDVYGSVYTDERRWWVCVDIGRRLLLVLLGVFVQDAVNRNFALLMGLLVILLVEVMTWPYKNKVDNWFALFVTWMLLVITCVTQPNLYLIMDPGRYASWTLVAFVLLIGAVLLLTETGLHCKKKKQTIDTFLNECITKIRNHLSRKELPQKEEDAASFSINSRSSSYRKLREPLLDDLPKHINDPSPAGRSSAKRDISVTIVGIELSSELSQQK